MEGEAWVGGSEGFGYTYRDRGVDSPVTIFPAVDSTGSFLSYERTYVRAHSLKLSIFHT
jgi:hypothetical protein